MKAIFSLLVLACLTLQVQAQIEWQRCYGGSADDECRAIRQTFDGGYVLAGFASSTDGDVSGNHGGADFWVVKISAIGAIEWQKCYGGSNDEEAFDIRQTVDSGYIVVGYTSSFDGDVSGNHGGQDFWVIKISDTGALQWQTCLGGSGDDVAGSVSQTSDSGYIVSGSTTSNNGDVWGNHGNGDYWVVKLTNTGNITWAKCYGGSGADGAVSVEQTFDGGYIVGGTSSSVDGDVAGHIGDALAANLWVLKLDTVGDIVWEKPLAGSSADYTCSELWGFTTQTNDGGYIVSGQTCADGGEVTGYIQSDMYDPYDGWVVKLTDSGSIQWDRCVYVNGYDDIYAIQQNTDSGYVIAGVDNHYMRNKNGLYGRLSSTGNINWVDTFGGITGNTTLMSVAATNDGGGIAVGFTSSNNGDVTGNKGVTNYWVVKFGFAEEAPDIKKSVTISIVPNPATNSINITCSGNISSINISNILGQKVLSCQYDAEKVGIDVSAFPPGMYFVKINGMETSKFVKE